MITIFVHLLLFHKLKGNHDYKTTNHHQSISVTLMLTSESEREGGVVSAIPVTGKSATVMQIGLVESFFTSLYLMCVLGEGVPLFKPVVVPFISKCHVLHICPKCGSLLQAVSAWLDPNTFSFFVPGLSFCINYSGNDCGKRRGEMFRSNNDAGSEAGVWL